MTTDLVTANYPKVVDLFESAEINHQLKKALPDFVTADKLIRVALTAIRTNQDLLKCSRQSLLACLFACGQLGLSPEPFLGQAYFVPYWNSKLGSFEALFIPGYRGYITLWRRSGLGKTLSAQVVYEKDDFTVQFGLHENLNHIPAEGERGGIKGAWTVFSYKDNTKTFEYMPVYDLMQIKERTKSKTRDGKIVGPWATDEAEMCKKTVIRRHMKLAPLSVDDRAELMYKASAAEEMALTGDSQSNLFLPEGAALNIEGDPEPVDRSAEFDQAVGGASAALIEFIRITAESNEISVAEVKTQAMDDLDNFLAIFNQWKEAQKQAPPEKKKSKTDLLYESLPEAQRIFWDEWRLLKASGFEKYVEKNLDLFKTCDPELGKIARKKYIDVVCKTWPLDQQSEPDDGDPMGLDAQNTEGDSTGQGENGEPGGSDGASLPIDDQLQHLKDKYPSFYLRVTGGVRPKDDEKKKEVILGIQSMIADNGGSVPSA